MKPKELIEILKKLPEKDLYFYDELSKLEFSLDEVKEKDDRIYIGEKWE